LGAEGPGFKPRNRPIVLQFQAIW